MISWSQNRAGAVVCVALLAAAPALANDSRRTAAQPDDGCPCGAAGRPRPPAPGQRRAALDQPAEDERAPETAPTGSSGDDGGDDDAPMPLPRRLRHKRPAKAAPSATEGSAAPLYVLGGLGIAGVIGYAVMVSWARDDNRRLADCAPHCSPASVDHIHNLYLAADVSLGIGSAALVATTWIYLATRPTRHDPGYSWNLRLLPGGVVAGLGGAF